MKKPKVIFLDWYKTLSTSLFWEQLEKRDKASFSKITHIFLAKNKDWVKPWMKGKFDSEYISKEISKLSNVNEDLILKELIKSAEEMTFVSKDLIDLVFQLRKKEIRIVIATDNMDTFTRWTVPSLKLTDIFDDILNSWDIKHLKQDFQNSESLFFKNYLIKNSIEPEDCVLIDDAEDKENKISESGIKYQRIKNPGEVINILAGFV